PLETLLNEMVLLNGYVPTTHTMGTLDWTKVVYPDTTPAYLINHPTLTRTRTQYTQDGRVLAEKEGTLATIEDPSNRTQYRYNPLGQLLEAIVPDGDRNPNNNPSTTYRYDTAGRRTHSTDANGYTTEYKYDELGRLVKTIFADETYTQTKYDNLGRRVKFIDPEGKVTQYKYDDLGRLVGVIETLYPGEANEKKLETSYGYDEAGRLVWTEDAESRRTKYEYDDAGRRTVVELPEGMRSVTTYDAAGNVKTVTDFNGEVMRYLYDEQHRLELKDLEDDADVTYTYTPDGQIETLTDGRGTTTFRYDELGRLIERLDPAGPYLLNGQGLNYSIGYRYDEAGNISQVRTPAGEVEYSYDEQNRLETVTSDGETTRYLYDDGGNLRETQFPNGVIERRSYDELNRLDVLEVVRDGMLLSRFDYTVNDAGHRLEVIESLRQPDGTLKERTVRYGYD
ncbi:MAG: hypothetical protein SVX43_09090, partial [Cyanobacteriota bacterium]|nr:hypothetical protein [Cyanobacteriota bacterium]